MAPLLPHISVSAHTRSCFTVALLQRNFYLGSAHCVSAFEQSCHCFTQKLSMSTPKIRLKPDRSLDVTAERDKLLRPIFKMRDLILRQSNDTIRLRYLEIKRKDLGLKAKNISVRAFMRRYPNIFTIYTNPCDNEPWCRLTKEVLDFLEKEKQIYRECEAQVVEKLRKLLMMAKDHRLRVGKLEFAKPFLGLPDDFATRVVPKYPQYFRLVGESPSPSLELVAWDESLAVSELEKRAKNDAQQAGLGDIEVRGQPLAFTVSYSPGMALRKKNLELLATWQKLPYVSPYQDSSWIQRGTALSDKRIVALLHEVLCLTIEKKILVGVIGRFHGEFGLPETVVKLLNRYPGIFYVSQKGAVKTIILREGYRQGTLIEDHPIVHLKVKYAQLVHAGPRLHASQSKPHAVLGEGNINTEDQGCVVLEDNDENLEEADMTNYSVDSEEDESESCEDYDDEDNDEVDEEERDAMQISGRAKRDVR